MACGEKRSEEGRASLREPLLAKDKSGFFPLWFFPVRLYNYTSLFLLSSELEQKRDVDLMKDDQLLGTGQGEQHLLLGVPEGYCDSGRVRKGSG